MWATAHTPILEKTPSVKDGWEKELWYRFIWYQGNQLPAVLDPKSNVPDLNGDENLGDEGNKTAEGPDMNEKDESEQSDSESEAADYV